MEVPKERAPSEEFAEPVANISTKRTAEFSIGGGVNKKVKENSSERVASSESEVVIEHTQNKRTLELNENSQPKSKPRIIPCESNGQSANVTTEPSGKAEMSKISETVEPVAGCSKDVDKPKKKSRKVTKNLKIAKKKEAADTSVADDNFTKPAQVRRRLRRNPSRQKAKNIRGKFVRKRSNSFKRRKEIRVIVPPTKFLLGGNINDPLNLNSLQDEEMNRAMNAVTPKSSPLPTPKHRVGEVEVILPRNLKDPLHLKSASDDKEYLKQLSKKKRKRKRKRGNSSSGSGKEESFEAGVPAEEPIAPVEGAFVPPDSIPPAKRESLTLNIKDAPKKQRKEGLDKIVSPVVPQPGAWKRGLPRPPDPRKRKLAKSPKFNPRNQRYQYGNYDRYYGYRNPNRDADPRLQCFQTQNGLFLDKDVLDIGCNIGHVTLCIARDFGARSVVGLDIDKKLIGIARKNIKHYVTVAETPVYCPSTRMATPHTPYQDSPAHHSSFPHQYVPNSPAYQQSPCANSPANRQSPYPNSPANRSPFTHCYVPNSPAYEQSPCAHQNSPSSRSPFYSANSPMMATPQPQSPATESSVSRAQSPRPPHPPFFPISMPIMYGPLEVPGCGTPDGPVVTPIPFPHNVSFVQGSYVLDSDSLLASETAQFDVILCLSITKWLHLNWGDAGLKRAFRRMFAQLRPGGKLILEPQAWPSYNKKKTLTESIYRNYLAIELLPDKFIEYLLSPAVGFSTVDEIGAPCHSTKGFRRPIHVLTKAGQTPSSCNTPVTFTPYAQRTCVRKPVYASLGSAAFDVDEEKKKDS